MVKRELGMSGVLTAIICHYLRELNHSNEAITVITLEPSLLMTLSIREEQR